MKINFLSTACLIMIISSLAPFNSNEENREHTKKKWKPLFNGKDFTGWIKYLGVPEPTSSVPGFTKDEKGKYTTDFGINNDPLEVYTIVQEDGSPAIKVSGEVFGTLITEDEYENYHLKLEFKWGQKKWPPRMHLPRDAGLLYHGFGKPGSIFKRWHSTQECQIQEGDTGDYWPIGGVTIDIPSVQTDTSKWWIYNSGAALRNYYFSNEMSERRCFKNPDNEKPYGQWNTVEIIVSGDSSIHIVNDKVVMRLYNSRKVVDGVSVPLSRGKISLQSEGAELYYRNIEIRKVND